MDMNSRDSQVRRRQRVRMASFRMTHAWATIGSMGYSTFKKNRVDGLVTFVPVTTPPVVPLTERK